MLIAHSPLTFLLLSPPLCCLPGRLIPTPCAVSALSRGDPEAALGYVVEAGGIAANADYPYKVHGWLAAGLLAGQDLGAKGGWSMVCLAGRARQQRWQQGMGAAWR